MLHQVDKMYTRDIINGEIAYRYAHARSVPTSIMDYRTSVSSLYLIMPGKLEFIATNPDFNYMFNVALVFG